MHPALYKLSLLTFKANWRGCFAVHEPCTGAFLIVFTMGFFAMMSCPRCSSRRYPTTRRGGCSAAW